jgi:hypothetical protein
MKPHSDPDLSQAMMARAGDLVAYMTRKGLSIAVAGGTAPNGVEATVIYATGYASDTVRDLGAAVVKRIAQMADEASAN